jgi:hypothetical protein
MALRRPPTRIDLKPEDIEEYDEVSARQESVIRHDALIFGLSHSTLIVLPS